MRTFQDTKISEKETFFILEIFLLHLGNEIF